ncbi:MAG: LysR substrate-binding domain-containing protein, partial [Burkholderiaceae bacterium]
AAALQRVATGHGSGVKGSVRITASEIVGVEILPPILAQLRRDHPALAVELVLSNKVDDLLRREADIAVRMIQPRQEALIARRIGEVELGLHAHRSYLEAAGAPDSLDALRGHTLIGFDEETDIVRRLLQLFGQFSRADLGFRANSDLAQLAALRAGFGIGVCQVGLGRRSPGLVRLLPEALSLPLETWVVMHEDLRESPRCAVTFAALAEGLARYIAVQRDPPA